MGENSEIYQRLSNIEQTMARIDERTATQLKTSEDVESRVHELELENAKRKGIMTVVAAIGGVVGSVAVWLIKHFTGAN